MAYIDDFLADKTRRKVVVTGIIAGGAALQQALVEQSIRNSQATSVVVTLRTSSCVVL